MASNGGSSTGAGSTGALISVDVVARTPGLARQVARILRAAPGVRVFSVATGAAGAQLPRVRRPRVLVVDATALSWAALARICGPVPGGPAPGAVALVRPGDPIQQLALVRAGALALLARPVHGAELVAAVRAVAAGAAYFGARVAADILAAVGGGPGQPSADSDPRLTARELEILSLRAAGMAYKEIADRLRLSQHTVTNHLFNVHQKLGVHSAIEAINIAFGVNKRLP